MYTQIQICVYVFSHLRALKIQWAGRTRGEHVDESLSFPERQDCWEGAGKEPVYEHSK